MTTLYWIVLAVALLRAMELVYARHNTRRLIAAGGHEAGAGHYPAIVALHAAWLLSIVTLIPATATPNAWLLGAFGVLQLLRIWVIASLGRFWTTRIITVPGEPLIRRGPYKICRHPNYAVVAAEIAILPMAFGAWAIALIFTALNGVLLWHRIQVENTALAARTGGPA